MIDHSRITAAKVAHRLSGISDIMRPDQTKFENYCKSIAMKPNCDIKRRNYEIEHTDDYGKLFLAEHHFKKVRRNLSEHIGNLSSVNPATSLEGNSMQNTKFMSSISDNIDSRVLPAIKALSHFTKPTDALLNEYESMVNNYKETIQNIKSSIPKGPGHYKKVCEKIMPEYIDFIKSNIYFINSIINNYSLKNI